MSKTNHAKVARLVREAQVQYISDTTTRQVIT